MAATHAPPHRSQPALPRDIARSTRLLWTLPRVAMVLLFAALAALFWFLHRSEVEEQRATLISDVLWAEQNLRFNLSLGERIVEELANDLASGALARSAMTQRMRQHLGNTPWLVQLLVFDAADRIEAAIPPRAARRRDGEGGQIAPSPGTARLARSLGRPSYSPPYGTTDGEVLFEIHAPLNIEGASGLVVGVISLDQLLKHEIPWWFAQRYLVSVREVDGRVLASKSAVTGGRTDLSYQVAFDPPGHGLVLHVAAYAPDVGLTRYVLSAAIVGLALLVLSSLWALRRHMQHRYAAEAALRDEHAFRKAMEDSLVTGLRARDLDGRITYVNPAFCRMVGYSEAELIGRAPPMPYWAPEEIERIRRVHDRVLSGDTPQEVEVRLMRRNGERFDAVIYEAPLIDASGRHSGWMGSVLDVSARKRAEELARQQQEKLQFTARLVTMGEMASTLAHELNQPLSAIASYNTGCLNKLEAGGAAQDIVPVLGKIGTQAQRAGAIIRRVHEFVRRRDPKREACELGAVIDDAVGLVEADFRQRGVRIDWARPARALPVCADRVMIEQVLLNLMRNGADAMGDVAPEDKLLTLRVSTSEDIATVAVIDHGCGVRADVAEKMYAPFFTTKVEGMGMGLNICRSILELHQGRLWFEPNPEGGTMFKFSLPLVANDD